LARAQQALSNHVPDVSACVYVCLSATLMLDIADTKRFRCRFVQKFQKIYQRNGRFRQCNIGFTAAVSLLCCRHYIKIANWLRSTVPYDVMTSYMSQRPPSAQW